MTVRRPSVVRIAALAPVVAVLLGATGADPASAAVQQDGPSRVYQIATTFSASGGRAVTYEPARVPVGANVTVGVREQGGVTTTTLTLRGLPPNSAYGARAHTNGCGPAGPVFQFAPDPVQPSTDPAFANPRNEIRLDLTTDAQGNGTATSTNAWTFPADRRARSVVLHDTATMTTAGTAGGRAACVDVKF